MGYNIKNYTEQGGDKTVIGGMLEIVGKLTLAGKEVKPVAAQADSTASTVTELKDDFNALLAKLKAAGLMT